MSTSHHRHSSTAASSLATSSPSTSQASSNNSTTTLIIAAVAASVGGIILIIVLVRFIRHRLKRNESAPLPPVQPIAHYREQQLAQFEEQKNFNGNGDGYGSGTNSRVSTWYDGRQHLTAPQQQFSFSPSSGESISDASLLQHANKDPDTTYADGSLDHEMSVMIGEKPPSPPPPFIGLPMTANNASGSESDMGVPDALGHPFPAIPPNFSASRNASPSPSLRPSPSPSPNPGPYPTSLPHLRHPRTRPSSLHSTTSRASRKSIASNLNVIRGAPHGPHSSVQIVLPAPLAAALGGDAYGRRSGDWGERREGSVRSRSRTDSHSRLSMVDKWAGVPGGGGVKGEWESGRENGRGRERERKVLKKIERNASSASTGASHPRTSMSTHSSSSHQPNSHSPLHLNYPHPSAHLPSKSPLFRSHSPHINASSSTSLSEFSPSPPHSLNHHSPSPPLPGPPAAATQLRTSSSAPPSAPRDHSRTPPPMPPPVPRIPSMYSNYNSNSNSNLDTGSQFASGSGMEVEGTRRSTPAAGFGSESGFIRVWMCRHDERFQTLGRGRMRCGCMATLNHP